MKNQVGNCVDCGVEFEYIGYRKKKRCLSCALQRVSTIAQQLSDHKGPEYEKWVKRMVDVGIPRQIEGLKQYQEELRRSVAQI